MDFFDKLGKKATEVYNNTAEKTTKITKEMKLKSLMNEDKIKINKLYEDIGKIVYEKYNLGEELDFDKDISEQCTKIDAYSKEIEDTLNDIRSLKDLKVCDACDKEITIKARFCPHCGTVQEESDVEIGNDKLSTDEMFPDTKTEVIIEVIGEEEE